MVAQWEAAQRAAAALVDAYMPEAGVHGVAIGPGPSLHVWVEDAAVARTIPATCQGIPVVAVLAPGGVVVYGD